MKRYFWSFFICSLTMFPCLGGLFSRVRLNPFLDRTGEIYPYTRHYFDECYMEVSFALFGKSMALSQRGDPGAMIPNPLTIVPGLFPLGIFEKIVVCPQIDAVLLPYDFFLLCRNHYRCGADGIVLKVMLDERNPATNMELCVCIEAAEAVGSQRVVYDGEVQKRVFETKLHTDGNGECYIPVMVGSYAKLTITSTDALVKGSPFELRCRSDGIWFTNNKYMPQGAEFGSSLYHVRRCDGNWSRAYNMTRSYCCFNCDRKLQAQRRMTGMPWTGKPLQSRWNKEGLCLACTNSLTIAEEKKRIMAFWREIGKLTALYEADVDLVVEHTGISRTRVKEILGFLPDPVMDGKNVIKVNLREEAACERLYAGKTRVEYLKGLPEGVRRDEGEEEHCFYMPGFEWLRAKHEQERREKAVLRNLAATLYDKPDAFAETLEGFTNANLRAEIRNVLCTCSEKAIPETNLVALLSAIDSLPVNMSAREKRIARGDVLVRKELPPGFLVDELKRAIKSKTPTASAHPILCNASLPIDERERAYSERRLAILRAYVAMTPSFPWKSAEKQTEFLSRFEALSQKRKNRSMSGNEYVEALDALLRETLPAQMPPTWRKCVREARYHRQRRKTGGLMSPADRRQ